MFFRCGMGKSHPYAKKTTEPRGCTPWTPAKRPCFIECGPRIPPEAERRTADRWPASSWLLPFRATDLA